MFSKWLLPSPPHIKVDMACHIDGFIASAGHYGIHGGQDAPRPAHRALAQPTKTKEHIRLQLSTPPVKKVYPNYQF